MASDKPPKSSYGTILRSSSIIGGAQIFSLLIQLARTKIVAILLGPAGLGLVGVYQSLLSLLTTVSGLGISQSAVRQVAESFGSGDVEKASQSVQVLRRTCWLTGILGTILTAALAWHLSVWNFGTGEHAIALALLGITLLPTSISSGQMAMIQGTRRIGDLARLQVLSALTGTLISIAIYYWMDQRGIVPVFILTALVNLGFSWIYARRVSIPSTRLSWSQTSEEARRLIGLGMAFMITNLLAFGVAVITRALILRRETGLEDNGYYQAAWGISGVFAGFILNAMGADFYPRITAVAKRNNEVNQLVNEQTEIGILLSLPGLIATLALSPLLIRILYSSDFTQASQMLPWFVLGVFGRVISWPMGYLLLARQASRSVLITETSAAVAHMLFIWLGLKWFGLNGVAIASPLLYLVYTLILHAAVQPVTGFSWSFDVWRLIAVSILLIGATFAGVRWMPELYSAPLGSLVAATSGIWCVRQICQRLGPAHRIFQIVERLPLLGRWIIG